MTTEDTPPHLLTLAADLDRAAPLLRFLRRQGQTGTLLTGRLHVAQTTRLQAALEAEATGGPNLECRPPDMQLQPPEEPTPNTVVLVRIPDARQPEQLLVHAAHEQAESSPVLLYSGPAGTGFSSPTRYTPETTRLPSTALNVLGFQPLPPYAFEHLIGVRSSVWFDRRGLVPLLALALTVLAVSMVSLWLGLTLAVVLAVLLNGVNLLRSDQIWIQAVRGLEIREAIQGPAFTPTTGRRTDH